MANFNPIDVHRILQNALPEGKKCEKLTVYEVWTANIDGEDVPVSVEPGKTPEEIAGAIVAELGSSDNAVVEGAQAPADEAEDDDHDEDEGEWVDDETAPKTSSKSKKKK